MYTTLFPCNECAKVIIESGIQTICYLTGEKDIGKRYIKASKDLLSIAGYAPFSEESAVSTSDSDRTRRSVRKRHTTSSQDESIAKRQKSDTATKK